MQAFWKWLQEQMNWKLLKSIYHANVNVNLTVENVIEIKSGITINLIVIANIWKNIICAKQVSFGILLHLAAKMVNI